MPGLLHRETLPQKNHTQKINGKQESTLVRVVKEPYYRGPCYKGASLEPPSPVSTSQLKTTSVTLMEHVRRPPWGQEPASALRTGERKASCCPHCSLQALVFSQREGSRNQGGKGRGHLWRREMWVIVTLPRPGFCSACQHDLLTFCC